MSVRVKISKEMCPRFEDSSNFVDRKYLEIKRSSTSKVECVFNEWFADQGKKFIARIWNYFMKVSKSVKRTLKN